ncbi:TraI domain-containing protein [Lonsdalea populi]|uniref:TraI domain-containing protein n=1 Tax=Lonsdalea populi TaxID=1172565 RepID=UPI001E343AA1|nr:TraI domain-containing protein [Lonsdalea populi]
MRGLNWLRSRSKSGEKSVADASLSQGEKTTPENGFRTVKTGVSLLQTAERQRLIRVLVENCPLSQQVIEAWWLRPLEELAARVQDCPAAWSGPFSGPGGFIDLSLNVSARAVRLTRGMMLPPGATPEEQAEQVPGWLCAVYWAGLLHHLEWLTQIQGMIKNGRAWYPGLSVPGGEWRVRREENSVKNLNGAYIAYQLLPDAGLIWLQRWPTLSHILLNFLSGNRASSCLLSNVINEASDSCGFNTTVTPTACETGISQGERVGMQANYIPPKLNESKVIPLSSNDGDIGLSEPIRGTMSPYTPPPQKGGIILSEDGNTTIPTLDSALSNEGAVMSEENDTTRGDDQSETVFKGSVLSILDNMVEGKSSCLTEDNLESMEIPSERSPSEKNLGQEIEEIETEKNSGSLFLQWLRESIKDGTLTVNESDSVLHVLSKFVFLASPACFYRFIKMACGGVGDKDQIQKNFESLGIHHSRNGRGLFHYHQHDSLDNRSRYTKVSGYMINIDTLLTKGSVLTDSQWISARK